MSDTPTIDRRTLAIATDTQLAALSEEAAEVQDGLGHIVDTLHRIVGDDTVGSYGRGGWKMTLEEVLATDPEASLQSWNVGTFKTKVAALEAARVRLDEISTEVYGLQEVWLGNGQWNRYFLVNNSNGHVHRGQDCSTCYPTTEYLWLVDLADCDERAMVAEYGELACTVCFPEAPTFKGYGDGTSAIARLSQAEKDAKAAEKAPRQAAKDAKAIANPDGSVLRDDSGSILKTERSASIRLTDLIQYQSMYGHDRFEEHIGRIAEALAHKQGVSTEEVIEAHEKKAAKRK